MNCQPGADEPMAQKFNKNYEPQAH